VVYLEILCNVGNSFIAFAPEAGISVLTTAPVNAGAMELEGVRWFAAVCFAFGGFLLVRVLHPYNPAALKVTLEALLVGDITYLASLVPFALKYGTTPQILAPFLLTLLMHVARLWWRFGEDWEAEQRRVYGGKQV
jgi:hypothetical protein